MNSGPIARRHRWLNQLLLAQLYQLSVKTINEHIPNHLRRYLQGNSSEIPNSSNRGHPPFRAIGTFFRVGGYPSHLPPHEHAEAPGGVQFRRWATERLQEYIVKGFVLYDQRLKGERDLGADYFDESPESTQISLPQAVKNRLH